MSRRETPMPKTCPSTSAAFDLVTCRIAPHHFPDIPKFVAEVHRVLKPGGVFALVDNAAPDEATNPGLQRCRTRRGGCDLQHRSRKSAIRATTGPGRRANGSSCIDDAGFEIEHTEILPKKMSFDTWIKNMSVPAEKVPGLATMLHEAKPAFAAYIQKREDDKGLGFTIAELMVIARKAG